MTVARPPSILLVNPFPRVVVVVVDRHAVAVVGRPIQASQLGNIRVQDKNQSHHTITHKIQICMGVI